VLGLHAPTASASVNDFIIPDYQIDYYLSRDDAGHSHLKTVEKITAEFPGFDQNHGIERAVPDNYRGHPTHLHIDSVLNQKGQAWNFTTYGSNANTVIRVGDADKYVHGQQQYVITYQQQAVTDYFANTKADEFYWDTNGTQWSEPISALMVRVHFDAASRWTLNGGYACYIGSAGSTDRCQLTPTADGYELAQPQPLQPSQNITVAFGFKPSTFAVFKSSPLERAVSIWKIVQLTGLILTVPGIFIFGWWYNRLTYRRREMGTIIAEYTPPKDVSVSTSAAVYRSPARVFSAQLTDLAVRGYLKIYETRPKGWFRSAQYDLEVAKEPSTLKAEELEILTDIFDTPAVGARKSVKTFKTAGFARKISDNRTKLQSSLSGSYGLRARDDTLSQRLRTYAKYSLIVAVLLLSPVVLLLSLVLFISSVTLQPLTDKGLELARYIAGLKLYIGVAEADRLRMLQSPEGVEKIGFSADPNQPAQLLKLYEQSLPYAILFGQETEWNKRLGEYYSQANQTPAWYAGTSPTFNVAAFSTAISNFSSATSSSAGGSSGGGSSGGGGGGGGGGGW
jgi:uncharacterized membrane protein YgcG